jgi:hypothetical protein
VSFRYLAQEILLRLIFASFLFFCNCTFKAEYHSFFVHRSA